MKISICARVCAYALTPALTVLPAHATNVWINELHYDNAGADVGEFVEIASAGTTDFTGWALQIYNGAYGTVLNTFDLSSFGILSNDAAALSFDSSQLQNGAPDGLALVDNSGSAVQFLSYEGSFVAIEGAAAGLMSEDIGVAESSSTPLGYSLQLVGTGLTYSDFSWVAGPESVGSLNSDQHLSAVPLPAAAWLFVTGLLGVAGVRRFGGLLNS